MNNTVSTTQIWSNNSYQHQPSNCSFDMSIYEKQHQLEGYQSFNKFQKSVDWSTLDSTSGLDRIIERELQDDDKCNYGGFMTSINEQMIEYFDKNGKKSGFLNDDGGIRRLTKSDTSILIDAYVN